MENVLGGVESMVKSSVTQTASPKRVLASAMAVVLTAFMMLTLSPASPALAANNPLYTYAGAEYGIYASTADANADNNRLDTLTTKADGTTNVSKALQLGTYYVKEVKAPTGGGFAIDSTVYPVRLTKDGATVTVNNGTVEEPTMYYTFNLQKLDAQQNSKTMTVAGGSLAGAEYKVEFYAATSASGTPNRTWTIRTDSNGVAKLDSAHLVSGSSPLYTLDNGTPVLPLGTIVVKETKASTGYMLDTSTYTYTMTSKDTSKANQGAINISSKEPPIKGGLSLSKIDADTRDADPHGDANLAGAEFTIYNASGADVYNGTTKITDGAAFMKITTNESGVASTGARDLPYGKYTVKETKPPTGYKADTDWVGTVTIREDSKIYETSGNPTDPIFRGAISVQKTDADTGKTTPQGGATFKGAQYQIINKSAARVMVGDETFNVDDVVTTLTTDEDGKASTPDNYLPYGTYLVHESVTPDGYMPAPDQTIQVREDGQVYAANDACVETVKKGDFRLVKEISTLIYNEDDLPQDNNDRVLLAGTTFQLINDSDNPIVSPETGEEVSKGEVVCTIVADVNGLASTKNGSDVNGWTTPDNWDGSLAYGTYIVHEVIPEDVAQAFEEKWGKTALPVPDWKVNITENGQYDEPELVNDRVPQTPLVIQKVDAETGERVPLQCSFQLFNANDELVTYKNPYFTSNEPMDTWTTNSAGEVTLPMLLEEGSYTVREVTAPYGYVLKDDPDAVFENHEYRTWDEPITVQYKDMPQTGKMTLKKTDTLTGEPVAGAQYELRADEDITTPDGTVRFRAGEIVGHALTDENGELEFDHLYLGKYTIFEAKAPNGYALDVDEHPFFIEYVGQDIEVIEMAMDVSDQPTTVVIDKSVTGLDYGAEGVEFRVWQDVVDAEKPYFDTASFEDVINAAVGRIVISDKANVLSQIERGAAGTVVPFTAMVQGEDGKFRNLKYTVTFNEDYTITVTDEAGEEVVTIEAPELDPGTEVFDQVFKTDESGKITIPYMKHGAYHMQEVSAPAPYVIDDNAVRDFVVNDQGFVEVGGGLMGATGTFKYSDTFALVSDKRLASVDTDEGVATYEITVTNVTDKPVAAGAKLFDVYDENLEFVEASVVDKQSESDNTDADDVASDASNTDANTDTDTASDASNTDASTDADTDADSDTGLKFEDGAFTLPAIDADAEIVISAKFKIADIYAPFRNFISLQTPEMYDINKVRVNAGGEPTSGDVHVGDTLYYIVSVTNTSESQQLKARAITDIADPGLLIASVESESGSAALADDGASAIWSVPELAPGATVTMKVTATVTEEVGSHVTNRATDGVKTVVVTDPLPSDLFVEKTLSEYDRSAKLATYTITIENRGGMPSADRTTIIDAYNNMTARTTTAAFEDGTETTVTRTDDRIIIPSVTRGNKLLITMTFRVNDVNDEFANFVSVNDDYALFKTRVDEEGTEITGPVKSGDTVYYIVRSENIGETTLAPITVTDIAEQSITITNVEPIDEGGSAPVIADDRKSAVWDTTELEPGASYSVKVTVTVDEDESMHITNKATDGKHVEVVTDPKLEPSSVAVEKLSDPESGTQVNDGDEITYTVRVKNEGHGPAQNIAVFDRIPEGTELTAVHAVKPAKPLGENDGPSVVDDVIGAGDQDMTGIRLGEPLTQGEPYVLPEELETSTTGWLIQNGDENAVITVSIPASTGVKATTYDVTLGRNQAFEQAFDAGVSVTLKSGAANIYIPALQGGDDSSDEDPDESIASNVQTQVLPDGSGIGWHIESLEAKTYIDLTFTVKVADGAHNRLQKVVNVATWDEDQPSMPIRELDTLTNEVEHPLPYEPGQLGWFTTTHKSSDPVNGTKVNRDDVITYTLDIANTGTETAPRTLVRDYIPEGTDYVDDSASDEGVYVAADADGNKTGKAYVEWLVTDIESNKSKAVTFQVKVGRHAPELIRNHALTDPEPDEYVVPGDTSNAEPPMPSNELVHPTFDDPTPPYIDIVKSADPLPSEVEKGSDITYTLTVTNTGQRDAKDIAVFDEIPANSVHKSHESAYDATFSEDVNAMGWNIPMLKAGKSVALKFTVTVIEDLVGVQVIDNQASWAMDKPELIPTSPQSNTTNKTRHIVGEPEPEPGEPAPTIEKDADLQFVNVGSEITYTITVTGDPERAIDNYSVVDTLGKGLAYMSSEPEGVNSNNVTRWVIDHLEAGETRTFTLKAAVTEELGDNVQNVVTINDPSDKPVGRDDVVTPTAPEPKPTIVKTTDVESVKIGDEITYTIAVTGDELQNIENFSLVDTLGKGLAYVSANPAGSLGDSTVTWSPVSIAAGETVIYTLTAKVTSDAVDEVENVAVLNDPRGDEVGRDNEVTPLADEPVLSIDKSTDVEYVKPGEQINYTITVVGDPSIDAKNYKFTDTLGEGLSFVSASNADSAEGQVITWTDDVPAGKTKTYSVTAKVADDAEGVVVNDVVLSDPSGQPVDEDSVETPIPGEPAPTVKKTADRQSVKVGDEITYTITVTGDTAIDAENWTVRDVLGTGLAYLSASPEASFNENVISWTTDIAANETKTFTVKATVTDDAVETVTNTVTLVNPDGEERGRDEVVTPLLGDLDPQPVVVKTTDVQSAKIGDRITYTLSVQGDPVIPIENYKLTDVLGDGLAYVSASPEGTLGERTIDWTVNLDAGETAEYTVVAVVTQSAKNSVVNTAVLSDPEGNEVGRSDVKTPIPGPCAPKPTLAKTVDLETAKPGDELTYTITLTGDGQFDIIGYTLTDVLCPQLEYVSDDAGATVNGQTLTWQTDLRSDETKTFTVKAKIADNATIKTVNEVTLSDREGNAVATAKAETKLPEPVDPQPTVVKTSESSNAKVGDKIDYTITVTGDPELDITGWSVADTPKTGLGLSYNGDELTLPEGFTKSDDGSTIYTPKFDLAAGEQISWTYSLYVTDESADKAENIAILRDQNDDPKQESEVVTPIVKPDPDPKPDDPAKEPTIKKTTSAKRVKAGDEIEYKLTVTGNGVEDLKGYTVRDTLEEHLAYVSSSPEGSVSGARTIDTVVTHENASEWKLGLTEDNVSSKTARSFASSSMMKTGKLVSGKVTESSIGAGAYKLTVDDGYSALVLVTKYDTAGNKADEQIIYLTSQSGKPTGRYTSNSATVSLPTNWRVTMSVSPIDDHSVYAAGEHVTVNATTRTTTDEHVTKEVGGQTIDWTIDIPKNGSVEITVKAKVLEGVGQKVVNNAALIDPDGKQIAQDKAETPAQTASQKQSEAAKNGASNSEAAKRAGELAKTGQNIALAVMLIALAVAGVLFGYRMWRRSCEGGVDAR